MSDHISELVFLFSYPKNPSKTISIFIQLLYKTNRLHFPMCVYCNRLEKTSQRVKNKSHAT